MNVDGGTNASKSLLGVGEAASKENRFTVVKELGRSEFGKTYLVKDKQAADELCVVREILPQITDKASVQKAKDLFEQEYLPLFQLADSQIPEFKELVEIPFQSETKSGSRLFLVRDYIPGQSYQEIANGRRSKNKFNETELTQLLQQMLPVLTYIHSRDVIHKDICPQNLILDQIEGQPVLVNFATVQEIAAKVRARIASEGIEDKPIRVGRVGYAPQEQLSGRETDETSDLYGLAATIVVLGTGETPESLVDTSTGHWQGFDRFSPKLGRILAKMLAVRPSDRYPSAQDVLAALRKEDPISEPAVSASTAGGAAAVASAAQSVYPQSAGTIAVENSDILVGAEPVIAMASPGFSPMDTPPDMGRTIDIEDVPETYEPDIFQESRVIGQPSWREALIALAVMLGFVATALLIASLFRGNNRVQADRPNSPATAIDSSSNSGEFVSEELARRQEIEARREQLGIDSNFFTNLVNQLFYQEYPVLLTGGPNNGPQPVTTAAADEPLRIRWDHIALDLLQKMEGNFTTSSLSQLGRYSENNRSNWETQVSEVGIEARSLYDLVDAKFFSLFPSQTEADFLTRPTGQLYYALADSQASAIAQGNTREPVTFDPQESSKTLSSQLAPGEGRLYTVALLTGQLLRLNIEAPTGSTLLSLYPPTSTDAQSSLIDNSEQVTWSGSLSETGDYELVVLNQSDQSISYQLALSVDSVTSAPVAPPLEDTPEDTEEPDSTTTGTESTNSSAPANNQTDSNEPASDRLENSSGLGINGTETERDTSERL